MTSAYEIFSYAAFDSAPSTSKQFAEIERFFNGLKNMALVIPENVRMDEKNGIVIFDHTKTAILLRDVEPSSIGKKTKQKDVVSSTASVVRPKITSFFKNPDVKGHVLLIPISGPKTREFITHGMGHCSTLIVWKGKSGKYLSRQFDPNSKNAVAIMTAVPQILKKISMESNEVPIMHGKNVYKEGEEGHCFAMSYEFIAKSLDGEIHPKKRKPAHIYNLTTNKYNYVV